MQAALQLQPNQQGAWEAYVSAVQAQHANLQAAQQSNPSSQTLTLPQRIDQREALSQQMQASRQSVDTALKQLYGSLIAQ